MKYKHIHFVGIKGVGMTPLAIIAKQAGFNVTGSDIADVFITEDILKKMNIFPLKGFGKSHVGDVDLVIATGAHGGLDNIEVKEAVKKGIHVVTQGEAVGLFMDGKIFGLEFIGISVSGTNGKTTTAAMIATVLKSAGLSPSYIIGTSFIPSLGFAGHLGKGKYFVAEADEYATDPVFDKTAKFLWQFPNIIVMTNIDFDHPDVYNSIDDVRNAFLKFSNQLPNDGLLIACGDDIEVKKLLSEYKGKYITYGLSRENEFVISEIKYTSHSGKRSASRISNGNKRFWTSQNDEGWNGLLEFRLTRKRQDLGNFSLDIFGEQNVLNATASIIVGRYLGLSLGQLKKGISSYRGSKRRSEFIGKLSSGALVYDDYAHNPAKVSATLKAFRSAYPNKRIVCIFQPHTYSRTKSLFEQFVRSFNDADTVVVTDIHASLREKVDTTVSSEDLVRRMSRFKKNVIYLPKLDRVVEYIDKKRYGEDTVVITMGAGDIYKINEKLILRQAQEKN